MTSPALRVGIAGCGLIGDKRAASLGEDRLVGCYDVDPGAAERLAGEHGVDACRSFGQLLDLHPDIVVVATVHSALSSLACEALAAGSHVLVEKPAGVESPGCRGDPVGRSGGTQTGESRIQSQVLPGHRSSGR